MNIILYIFAAILILELTYLIILERKTFGFVRELKSRICDMQESLSNNSLTEEEQSDKRKHTSDLNSFDSSDSPSAEKLRVKREKQNRDSVIQALKDANCNPELNENDDVSVSYQGENFLLQFNGAFIRIWDLSWLRIKNTDDNFTILKDAANYANFSFGPAIIMHSPDEEGRIVISSRMDILYVPSESDNEGYITAVLDSFFGIKHSLHRELDRLNSDPSDRTLFDNPIGFDTASLSDQSSPQAN